MRRLTANLLPFLMCCAATGVQADTTLRPFYPAELSTPAPACNLPPVASAAQVIGISRYTGRELSFQIDKSGSSATQIDVMVHADKPIVLLVSAYEPTIWNIGWSKGTVIAGVYAMGNHRQAVAGLPSNVPVVTTSVDDAREGGCEGNYIEISGLASEAKSKLNKPITRLYAKASARGVFEVIESQRQPSEFVTSTDRPPESFRDVSAPLAGKAGLDAAVAAGVIRLVTPADQALVRNAFLAQAKKSSAKMPPVAGMTQDEVLATRLPNISIGGYVVLRAFTYPAGLYGGNAAEFLIPKGVPHPKGDAGHSKVIDLTEITCSGALCG